MPTVCFTYTNKRYTLNFTVVMCPVEVLKADGF